jgi:hypothetical protein
MCCERFLQNTSNGQMTLTGAITIINSIKTISSKLRAEFYFRVSSFWPMCKSKGDQGTGHAMALIIACPRHL